VLAKEEVDVGWRMVVAAIDVECSSVVAREVISWLVVVCAEGAGWDWMETAQRRDFTAEP
jgi:hypothetical protein